MTPADGTAAKADGGKLPLHLVPPELVFAVAQVLGFGAAKYGERNWERGGLSRDRLWAAAQRHLWAYQAGERLDAETGYSHLWHAACEIAFMIAYEERGLWENYAEG